jgi:hypothetical protein
MALHTDRSLHSLRSRGALSTRESRPISVRRAAASTLALMHQPCFVFNIYNVRGNQHALLIGSLGDRGDDGAEMTTRVRTIVNAMQP